MTVPKITVPRITIVGLGPGDPSLLTSGTLVAIEQSGNRFLRTGIHPSAGAVVDARTFDHLYDQHAAFADVYDAIVSTLLAEARVAGEVLYAVPGSPAVAERTVELLLEQAPSAGVDVVLVPALSFADLAWVRLGVDPLANPVTLVDAHRFAEDVAGRRGPFLVAQCHSNVVMNDIKLVVSELIFNAAELPQITILHHLGLPDEVITTVAWPVLDQTLIADHLTALYIPELPHSVGFAAERLWALMERLRRECPWNEEQTAESLVPYAVEEAHELAEAVLLLGNALSDERVLADSVAVDSVVADSVAVDLAIAHYQQELGDVLYQVLFHSIVAADEGWFSFEDVIRGLHAKLVYRHPHIFPRHDFDPGMIRSSDDVVRNWEKIKAAERFGKGP